MHKGRLEAFSDGVIAILITIMVLELKVPHEPTVAAMRPLIPILLSYALSFVFLGIYWNNHHHMLQAARHVDGRVLWANLHLMFWLSLVPFATNWMGETSAATLPVALYGVVLALCGVAYYILAQLLVSLHGSESTLGKALGSDVKGRISLAIYLTAIPLAFVSKWIALACYVAVAIMWLVPDLRIERAMRESADDSHGA